MKIEQQLRTVSNAGSWRPEADETWLAFETRRFGLPIVGGRFNRFEIAIPDTGRFAREGFELRIDAGSLDTGNPRRDQRLRGPAWLDAGRFPEIAFQSRRIQPVPVLEGELTRVSGDLTIRGVTHPVDWEFELLARAEAAAGTLGAAYLGSLELSPRWWGVGGPALSVTIWLRLQVVAAGAS